MEWDATRRATAEHRERLRQLDEQPTGLYRLFDEAGQLLYVGISKNPKGRFHQHSFFKYWWHLVADKSIEWHEDRASALRAEDAALISENPIYNSFFPAGPDGKRVERPQPNDPFWRPLAEQIYREIETGVYEPGEVLPLDYQVARRYGRSLTSTSMALGRLSECGLVSRQRTPTGKRLRHVVLPPPYRHPIEFIQELTPGERFEQESRAA